MQTQTTQEVKAQRREWPVTRLESQEELQCLVRGDVVVLAGNRRMVLGNNDKSRKISLVRGYMPTGSLSGETFSYDDIGVQSDGSLLGEAMIHVHGAAYMTPELEILLGERGLL